MSTPNQNKHLLTLKLMGYLVTSKTIFKMDSTLWCVNLLMLNVQDVDPVPVEMHKPELRVLIGDSSSNFTSKYETLELKLSPKNTSLRAKTGKTLDPIFFSSCGFSVFKGWSVGFTLFSWRKSTYRYSGYCNSCLCSSMADSFILSLSPMRVILSRLLKNHLKRVKINLKNFLIFFRETEMVHNKNVNKLGFWRFFGKYKQKCFWTTKFYT